MDKHYNTYTIDQLVEDTAFCDWVISNKKNDQWTSWVAKQSDQRIKNIEEAKTLVSALSHNKEAGDMDTMIKDKLWNRINTTIATTESKPKSTSKIVRMITIASAIAASLLLFVIFNPLSSANDDVEIYAENNMSIELPASSKVDLSQDANITYATDNWDTERRVQLSGEAFFDVTKGKPFIIETDNGTVSVLGTSFTVISEEQELYVDVKTGRVEVASSVKTAILEPSDRYWLNIPDSDISSYQAGTGQDYFVFQQTKVRDILLLIKRVYNVKINTDLVNVEAPVTSFFDTKDDLNQALENILFPLHLKFVVKEDQVVLM